MSDDQARVVGERLAHMVQLLTNRVQWMESRREMLGTNVSGAIIATGLAVLTFGSRAATEPLRLALAVSGLLFTATGGLMLMLFMHQTNAIPTLPSNKWFYKGALTRDGDTLGVPLFRKDDEAVVRLRSEADARMLAVVSEVRKDARENLDQVFALHVLDRFRHKFVERLRRILTYGAGLAIGAGFVTWVIASASAA